MTGEHGRIVIVGGGFGGVYTALALERLLPRDETCDITLINRSNYFLYFPLLPEVVSGGVEASHMVVPLRTLFRRVRVLEAEVRSVDLEQRSLKAYRDPDTLQETLQFDQLVLAMGAEANLAAFPTVEPYAFPFKSTEDAIALHNQVIDACEAADFCSDERSKRSLLTFVVVGGGSTGVECMGEVEAFLNGILPFYPRLRRDQIRLVLIELEEGILSEVGCELGKYAAEQLRHRGIELHLGVSVQQATPHAVTLSNGLIIPTRTLVWAIGSGPSAFLKSLNAPKTAKGWLHTEPTLSLPGHPGIWALGDAARIPSPDGGTYPPTAQHAVREAERLARNIIAYQACQPLKPYVYHTLATFISIGGQKGVAMLWGRPIKGFLAWVLWRLIHFVLLPGGNRKLRVAIDWLLSRRTHKDIVQIGLRLPPNQIRIKPVISFLREGQRLPDAESAEPPIV